MKEKLYQLLVNHVPGIRERYLRKRETTGFFLSLPYLLWLNLRYYLLFPRDWDHPGLYEEKKLRYEDSESSLSLLQKPEEFAAALAEYDIISFDVFDTLLFRPFSRPEDLFQLLGARLGYPNLKPLRVEAERQARQRSSSPSREVTLEEIWDILSLETGIPKTEGMREEIRLEKQCCFPNPYMLAVVEELGRRGKTMIASSDMYLSADNLRDLLEQCGFRGFSQYFVSSEYKKAKHDGSLYGLIRQEMGTGLFFAHVGDHEGSDLRQAVNHGFTGFLYPNVNAAGAPYRPEALSTVTGSIFRGIVNAHIHNGLSRFSREYEYGFLYGGLFAVGYCRFIQSCRKKHGIEKLLFLSRDGYLLQRVYRLLFPEEEQSTVYAYWSRQAAVKYAAPFCRTEYFRRFLTHKENQGFSIRQILDSMDLEFLLDSLCQACGLSPQEELTNKNRSKVKNYLTETWEQILTSYRKQSEAGRQYYAGLLKGIKRAAAVDIGWEGSGPLLLNLAVNRVWDLHCPITGILAGVGSGGTSDPFLFTGQLEAYLFSPGKNRDLWKFHDPSSLHNLYWELLLGAPEGSLRGFDFDEKGQCRCVLNPAPAEPDKIREIHRGVLDFVSLFLKTEKRLGMPIPVSGRDAYAPMLTALHKKNRPFLSGLEGLLDEMQVG